jgi:hypothetical protein
MNIAVSKGAKEGLRFVEYINWLDANGHITKESRSWVEHIRDRGNEATHKIIPANEEDATDLIEFSGMLLKTMFEYPEKMKKKKQTP